VIAGVPDLDPVRLAVLVLVSVRDPVPDAVLNAVRDAVTVGDTLFVGLKVLEAVVVGVPV